MRYSEPLHRAMASAYRQQTCTPVHWRRRPTASARPKHQCSDGRTITDDSVGNAQLMRFRFGALCGHVRTMSRRWANRRFLESVATSCSSNIDIFSRVAPAARHSGSIAQVAVPRTDVPRISKLIKTSLKRVGVAPFPRVNRHPQPCARPRRLDARSADGGVNRVRATLSR